MDKDLAKRLFRTAGVPTADWLMAPVEAAAVEQALGWPVVVKPSKQGSTVGLTVVRTAAALAAAIQVAAAFVEKLQRVLQDRDILHIYLAILVNIYPQPIYGGRAVRHQITLQDVNIALV